MLTARRFVAIASLAATLGLASTASAQDEGTPQAPPASGAAITRSCSLGEHAGIDDVDARTAADVICHELNRQGAGNTAHEVRFGRLGGKTLVTVARTGGSYDERRLFVGGIDEVVVAAPRLVDSLTTGRSIEETRGVDNVVASETRAPLVQRGQTGFDGALFGTTTLGAASGASAGVDLGILHRAGNLGVGLHGRAGGIGSTSSKLAQVGLDIGARYYFSSADVAPYLGGGLGLNYFNLSNDAGNHISGSGLGAHAQVGVEMFRSHHTTLSLSVRADIPFYELSSSARGDAQASLYVIPLSLNAGIAFH